MFLPAIEQALTVASLSGNKDAEKNHHITAGTETCSAPAEAKTLGSGWPQPHMEPCPHGHTDLYIMSVGSH